MKQGMKQAMISELLAELERTEVAPSVFELTCVRELALKDCRVEPLVTKSKCKKHRKEMRGW